MTDPRETDLPDPLQQRMLDALDASDGDRLMEVVMRGAVLPSSMLVPAAVPVGPHWGTLEQGFALTFDGYAHCDDVYALLARAEAVLASGGDLGDWSIDDLRTALFALQRMYRDTWGTPDARLVGGLLAAIRAALASRE
jgi:hypothetical protein